MYLVRSRVRAIINNNKTTRMAEHSTQTSSSSEQNQSPILSAFLGSPRFFGGFLSRTISDEISVNTPTSILDSKQFSNHPFGYHEKRTLKSSPPPPMEKKGIGLVLIHDDKDEEIKHSDEPTSKMVLFASNLKVQVPPFLTDNSPNSPGDFGIKTKNNNSQLLRSLSINSSPRVVIRGKLDDHQEERLSVTEMEMSEEYTCVMTHGPNPKTTHIFDDTIVESCCGFRKLAADQKMEECLQHNNDNTAVLTSLPLDFLGFCYTCKLKLDDGKDIYIFRGEKAFCSDECRFQEMVMEGNKATNNLKLHEDEEDCYHF